MTIRIGPISLLTEQDTARLAQRLAPVLVKGDCILLVGHIGAGKTAFARALIRSLIGENEDVPSPTFTLVQTYETAEFEIWHCDLYRLSQPDEVMELGLDAALDEAVTIIEWPDRLGELVPEVAITLEFAAMTDHHLVTVTAPDIWGGRLDWINV